MRHSSFLTGFCFALAFSPMTACCHWSGTCPNTPVQQAAVDCSLVAWDAVKNDVWTALLTGKAPDGSAGWQAYLESKAVAVGLDEVLCAVEHFVGAQKSVPASGPAEVDIVAVDRANEFLAAHNQPVVH